VFEWGFDAFSQKKSGAALGADIVQCYLSAVHTFFFDMIFYDLSPIREDGFISTGNATDSASVGVQANRKPSNLGGNEQVGMKLGFLE